jgi:hypothetical protein
MQTRLQQPWRQAFVAFLIICASIAAIGWLQWPQLLQLKAGSQIVSVEELERQADQERLRLSLLEKMPTFGFNNLIADWTFLSFLQYFGDEPARLKTDYGLSPDYFEVILSRDPYFTQAYTFLSTSGSIYAGKPEQATEIMQRGLQSLKPNVPPDSFYAWRQLGIDQLLFLGDSKAAQQSFLTSAQWAAQSSLPGSREAAVFSQRTADFLAANPNSKSAQVAAWAMVLTNAPDNRTRKTAIERIRILGGQVIQNPNGSFGVQPPAKD